MTATQKQMFYRLIALWAVCEGVLGGIIHGFELPISGFIVGGAAVIIICLIAWYIPSKGAIVRATLIVCIFKMMLSPQSPLPAYFAVLFQGLTGELFFIILPLLLRTSTHMIYKFSCILFAVLALAESGVQKILVMTLYYGKDIWVAFNAFVNSIAGTDEMTNHSLYFAGGYVALHIIEGILLGIVAGRIPAGMVKWANDPGLQLPQDTQESVVKPAKKRRSIWRNIIFLVWIALLILYLQSVFHLGKPIIEADTILDILVRSAVILFTWYFFVSPLLTAALKKWLQKQQAKNENTVNEILLLIPSTKTLVEKSWHHSAGKKGFSRLNLFLKSVLVNSLDNNYDRA